MIKVEPIYFQKLLENCIRNALPMDAKTIIGIVHIEQGEVYNINHYRNTSQNQQETDKNNHKKG